MALPRSRSYLGIAKEATGVPGIFPTPVAATDFIAYTSITPFDNITKLDDKGIRGSMTEEFGVIDGPRYSEFDLGGDVFADTIGYMYAGVLGDVVTSGATAPYQHDITLLNSQASNGQPTSYTLSDYYGEGADTTRLFAGSKWASVDTKFSADALLTYTAKAMGFASDQAANPTPTFSTVQPIPSWVGEVVIGGIGTAAVSEGNINISRSLAPIFTVADANPYEVFAGPLTVDGSLTLVLENDDILDKYLSNTQGNLEIEFQAGTGVSQVTISFIMSKVAFTVAKVERGKDYVELAVDYKAIANTTNAGTSGGYAPIAILLQNAKPSGTYV